MKKTRARVLAAVAGATVASMLSQTAQAADYTWSQTAGGTYSWNVPANWGGAGFPNAAGDTGNLSIGLTGNLNVALPIPVTIGHLTLGGTGAAVATDIGNANFGGNSITFNNTGGTNNSDGSANPSITSAGVAGSVNLISAPVSLVADTNITQASTNSLSLSGLVVTSTTANASAALDLLVNLTDGKTLTIGNITSAGTGPLTASITNELQFGHLNDSTTTQWGTINLNGVISNGAPIDTFNVNTRIVFGAGGQNSNNNTIATINVNGNNTYGGGARLFRANVVLGSDTAFGTGSVQHGSGASANSTGYNLFSTDDARTIGNAFMMQRNVAIKGDHSMTWAGTVTQSNASNFFNLLPEGKTFTFSGVGGTVSGNSTAGVAIATDRDGTGRLFTFDGPGRTVVSGNLVNNNDGGVIDVYVGAVSTNGQVAKNGTGVVVLSGAANTYGLFTAVNGGTLEFASAGAVGNSTSALANPGGAIGITTGTLASFTHPSLGTTSLPALVAAAARPSTGSLALSAADAGTNADFTTGSLANPNAVGMSLGALSGTVNYTGTITPAAGGYRLGGGAGTLSLAGANALTGARALTVTNGGKVVLGGANNYTGATTIQGNYVVSLADYAATNSQYNSISVTNENAPLPVLQDTTLSIAKVADGDSSIGNAGPAASNLVISGGTLQYTGPAATTGRGFSVGTLGATLDSSGSGAVTFSNPAAIGLPDVAAGSVTGTTAASSNAVTAVADASALTVGMSVTGANIPEGTTITGIRPLFGTSTNVPNAYAYTVYLSANATGAGTDTPLTFGSQNRTLTLTGSNAGANTIAGALGDSATGSLSVSKTGAGTWNLTGAQTYTGSTDVSAGRLVVASNLTATSAVNVTGGTLELAAGAGGNRVIKADNLAVSGGRIDLKDNKLITASPVGTWTGSAYDGVSGLVDTARGNLGTPLWDGPGITTSDTRAQGKNLVSIGVAKVGQVKGIADTATTTFAGQTVLGSDTIAMVTYGGDATLDGKINIDDYGRIDANVSQSGSVFGWYNGDFNYDGAINIDDYGIIDGNISNQGDAFPTAASAGAADGVSAVPEPASLSLLALAAMSLGRRRRRM